MIAAAWVSLARAEAPEPEPEPLVTVAVGVRGTTEAWSDPAIAQVYRSGTWFAGLGVVVRVGPWLAIDAEGTFRRLRTETSQLELAPLSLLAELHQPIGAVDGFVGIGPTWTSFSESAAGAEVVSGARVAGELRTGIRVDTGFVRETMDPSGAGPVRAIELELMVGRRSEVPGGDGFRLGAWRGAVGLLARF